MTEARGIGSLEETVARIRDGDLTTFEAVFRQHYEDLCSWADRYLAAPDIAEEVVQDVFAHLWSERRRLEITSSLRGWLFTAVRNRALNQARRSGFERPFLPQDAPAAADTPETETITRDDTRRLDDAIARLPDRCREAMVLRWKHGLRHAEIAEAMGVTVKAVERHITRGLDALRTELTDRPD